MPFEVELEEYRQLQTIIARHEDHAFKIRGVMYALLTALSVAVFAKDRLLTGWLFLILAVLMIGLFLVVELVHRGIVRLAINRVGTLEDILRSGGSKPYDGPRIGLSLGQNMLPKMIGKEALMPWIVIHYVGLVAAVVAIGIIGW